MHITNMHMQSNNISLRHQKLMQFFVVPGNGAAFLGMSDC